MSPTVLQPIPPPSPVRRDLLGGVADHVPTTGRGAGVLVGVDGPDGAGKSVLATELAAELARRGRTVVQASLDRFHRPRAASGSTTASELRGTGPTS